MTSAALDFDKVREYSDEGAYMQLLSVAKLELLLYCSYNVHI